MKIALFDLDETLVASKAIKDIRESGKYAELTLEHLNKTQAYPKAVRVLEALSNKGVRLGLVSNAGKQYVDRLIDHHDLRKFFSVIVTYTDVGKDGAKPKPGGLLKAISQLGGVPSPSVIYVGDHDVDMEAAYAANVTPIIPAWASRSPVEIPPAFEACSSVLMNYFESPDEYSLFAERVAHAKSARIDRKAVYFLPLNERAEVVTYRPELRIFGLGRYFSQKSTVTVGLHDKHALSMEIGKKNTVENYQFPQYLVDAITHVVSKASAFVFNDGSDFDIVTVIPSKTGRGRMELLLEGVKSALLATGSKAQFIPDVFFFTSGARDQKTLSRSARAGEVERHLHLKRRDALGRKVLILDDVITSGATMRRAIELLSGESSSVAYGVALAKTVSILDDQKLCPKCGSSMVIRTNSQDGSRFRGCSRYKEAKNPCRYTESMGQVEQRACKKCGAGMKVRTNRTTKQKFWGCSGYPDCDFTEDFNAGV